MRRKLAEIPDLFGDENLQSYQTNLERKSGELPGLFGDENLQSYQTYLENTCRATIHICRGQH
jgi:hypothetical protein